MPSQISEFDRDHVEDILHGFGDWFSARLLRLIAHADYDNKETIRRVYPDHVDAYDKFVKGTEYEG